MNYPDKKTYKTTITDKLRKEIIETCKDLINQYELISYLEIGCDQGYTLCSIASELPDISGIDLIGIDIDNSRCEAARLNASQFKNVEIVNTTSDKNNDGLLSWNYDVILIDGDHSYEGCLKDIKAIMANNSVECVVFFHDYGLANQEGVRRVVQDLFSANEIKFCGEEKDWNELGAGSIDWEAACVRLDWNRLDKLKRR
jgi:hypothetical protein